MINFDEVVSGMVGKDKEESKGPMIKEKAWGMIKEAMKMLDMAGFDAPEEIQSYVKGLSMGEAEAPEMEMESEEESEEMPESEGEEMMMDEEEPSKGGLSKGKKEAIVLMLKKKAKGGK